MFCMHTASFDDSLTHHLMPTLYIQQYRVWLLTNSKMNLSFNSHVVQGKHTLFMVCNLSALLVTNSPEGLSSVHTQLMHISNPVTSQSDHTLFIVCDLSASHLTASPEGMCLMRTADSVLFTCCPPAPPDRIVVISKSVSGTSILFTCSPAA